MSQQPGFDVMDIDTSIANDPKFRRIHRTNADLVSTAFMAYVALLGESWKAAERVTIEDAWPALLPFDTRAVESMQTAGLIDSDGRIPSRAWRKRFAEANKRRIAARARWRRHNDKRGKSSTNNDATATDEPRGSDVDTATSVPSVPFRPSVRSDNPLPPLRNGATPLPNALAEIERQRKRAEAEPIRSLADRGITRP